MGFPLKDVRVTSRRSGSESVLYPRLLRDRSVLPKIEIAIRHFESLVGSERRALDPEVLVHFFGDHKLARCMVGCLALTYRYRARTFDEIVTRGGLRALRRAGADRPLSLRALLYERINADGPGFLATEGREERIAALERELRLRGGELERLLYLDADEHAILTRIGQPPTPEDLLAQHNLGVLCALLCHAERVELRIAPWSAEARAAVLALAAANGVEAEIAADGRQAARLRLLGRQDALGNWSRHGRRLMRAVAQVLERGRGSVTEGSVHVWRRERRGLLKLTDEALDILAGGGRGAAGAGWSDDAGWAPADIERALAEPRPVRDGARVRRRPEPRAWAAGVVSPDALVQVGRERALLCAVRSEQHAAWLARVAPTAGSGEPLLCAGAPAALAPLVAAGVRTLALPSLDMRAVIAALRAEPAVPAARVA